MQHSTANRILPATLTVTKKTTPSEIADHQVSVACDVASKTRQRESWAMTWNCCLHGWAPSVLQALEHMCDFLLGTVGSAPLPKAVHLFWYQSQSGSPLPTLHAMDGTFTKEIFNLAILLAASVDANNHSVLLA